MSILKISSSSKSSEQSSKWEHLDGLNFPTPSGPLLEHEPVSVDEMLRISEAYLPIAQSYPAFEKTRLKLKNPEPFRL